MSWNYAEIEYCQRVTEMKLLCGLSASLEAYLLLDSLRLIINTVECCHDINFLAFAGVFREVDECVGRYCHDVRRILRVDPLSFVKGIHDIAGGGGFP